MAGSKESKLKVREVSPDEITLDDRNLNRHTEKGRSLVNKSFSELGAGRSGVSDRNGKMIAGNLSVETAIEKGLKIVEVETEGDTYVVVKRTDLDLDSTTDNRARKLALADNVTSAVSLEWDFEEMKAVSEDFGFEVGEWGVEIIGSDDESGENGDNYSRKVKSPVYEAKNEKPPVVNLFDDEVTKKLCQEIEAAELQEDEKAFLLKAAQRHTVFNYEQIADYYANSSPTVQRLMENSALVIIDFNRAIELGFVKLSNEVAAQYTSDYADEE